MPFYDYKCNSCENIWEEFQSIKNNKKPEKKPCPNCGKKEVKQIILQAPNCAVDTEMRITNKAKGGFKDVMQKTLAPLKGTKAEKFWKNRYGI